MTLNPLDIQQKTFRVALKGYAEDEVDEFLDEVVMTIREYEQMLVDARGDTETLQARLDENRDTEASLSKTLLVAQRAADQITEEARRESERVMSDARADASRLSVEHGREKNQLIDELDRLREIVRDVKARLADISSDVSTRMDPVLNEMDSLTRTAERWEEPYQPPLRSAIDDLRDEEDIDDNGNGDGPEGASDEWDDGESDAAANDGVDEFGGQAKDEQSDNDDDPGEKSGSVDEDEAFDPVDIRGNGDDDEGFSDSGQTSAARRPWERYDD